MLRSFVLFRRRVLIVTALALLVGSVATLAQEEEDEDTRKQAITISGGAVYVPDGAEDAGADVTGKWVGAIGVGYKHKVREPWSLGAVVEVELDSYLIVDGDLNRENPLVVVGLAYHETLPQFEFYAGGGVEIETNKTLAVLRIGFEYEFLIKEMWIIAPTFFFDVTTEYPKLTIAAEFGRWF